MRLLLAAVLLCPSPSFAQVVKAVSSAGVPSVVAPSDAVLGLGSPSSSFTPSLSSPLSPALSGAVLLAPSLVAVDSPLASKAAVAVKAVALQGVSPSVLTPTALKPALTALNQRSSLLAASFPDVPVSETRAAGERSFALLVPEALAPRSDADFVLAASKSEGAAPLPPSTPDPARVKNVRRMMLGTAAMKSGMETITLSVPMLALTAFGGISAVAGLVVVYGLSQAVFAGMSGGLADRYSARKVLAGAVLAQAALVATLIAVGAMGALSMGTLIPLYLLIGGVTGVIETTRHSIPALLLGQDEGALKKYNATLHISYETAGVIGALTAGALIGLVGPLWSLAIQPPAFALAAWYFWRVKHATPAGHEPGPRKGPVAAVKDYFGDIKAGAKLVLGGGRMRWVALAFVLPQIVHRVFENLLIPVFAKKVLENPSASAWLLTASNAGELAGAAVLLRLAARFPGAHGWTKWGALGLLLIWALAFSHSLPILLPLILVSSLTWAASDLSLRSEVQKTVSEKEQPRALAFLYGAFVLGSALASLALGGLLDALGATTALYIIGAGITVLSLTVLLASRRLKKSQQP